jgi:hypothetical protein
MILKSLDYSEYQGTSREWSLSGLALHPTNLIVGKNATGKTRTLNVVHGLGRLISGRQAPSDLVSGSYRAVFEHEGRTFHYFLDIRDRKVIAEEFHDGKDIRLRRGAEGVGTIFHEKEQRTIEFQTPETKAAVVARLDSIQHGFLQPLSQWGFGVRHYPFGDTMGRTHIALLVPDGPAPDPADVNAVIGLFRKANKEYPGPFADAVKADMNEIGYNIDDIGVMAPTDLIIQAPSPIPVTPSILYVKEHDLSDVTQQLGMSQGMFRALSVIIHLNFAAFENLPSCIIIDDIGEGLDFDRSCKLINLVRRKSQESSVQLIMATNDRFVMNNVPLEEWSVLEREGSKVKVRNYENSKPVFDQFKFTGLNNFDFLATDFLSEGIKELTQDDKGNGSGQQNPE